MKQLAVNYHTAYRWWRNDKRDIRPGHLEELKVAAEEHIAEMSARGFSSGQLVRETPTGISYIGWWEITSSDNNQH